MNDPKPEPDIRTWATEIIDSIDMAAAGLIRAIKDKTVPDRNYSDEDLTLLAFQVSVQKPVEVVYKIPDLLEN